MFMKFFICHLFKFHYVNLINKCVQSYNLLKYAIYIIITILVHTEPTCRRGGLHIHSCFAWEVTVYLLLLKVIRIFLQGNLEFRD